MDDDNGFLDVIGGIFGLFWLVTWIWCWVKLFQDLAADVPHPGVMLIHLLGCILGISPISVWF